MIVHNLWVKSEIVLRVLYNPLVIKLPEQSLEPTVISKLLIKNLKCKNNYCISVGVIIIIACGEIAPNWFS